MKVINFTMKEHREYAPVNGLKMYYQIRGPAIRSFIFPLLSVTQG